MGQQPGAHRSLDAAQFDGDGVHARAAQIDAFAIAGLALVRTPGLLAPVAVILAVAAARMTETHRTLAGAAVIVAALSFFFGMIVSISTDAPLF